jgi:hypothetical protein
MLAVMTTCTEKAQVNSWLAVLPTEVGINCSSVPAFTSVTFSGVENDVTTTDPVTGTGSVAGFTTTTDIARRIKILRKSGPHV